MASGARHRRKSASQADFAKAAQLITTTSLGGGVGATPVLGFTHAAHLDNPWVHASLDAHVVGPRVSLVARTAQADLAGALVYLSSTNLVGSGEAGYARGGTALIMH